MECQNLQHGCQAVFAYKVPVSDILGCAVTLSETMQDMCWHHKMCQFAHHPHPNVLPAMPKKRQENGSKRVEGIILHNGDLDRGPTL